jgi:hypothetical protein
VGDGDAGQQLVELLVVADGKENVARDDARLLVVLGHVLAELLVVVDAQRSCAVHHHRLAAALLSFGAQ